MSEPPVTILMPAKGNVPYIVDALRSVNNQEYSGQIYINIVDDGIDEDVFNRLYEFKDVTILRNFGNGIVDALNTGLEFTRSEFVVRLDSDDLMLPSRIRKQISFLMNHNDVSVVGTQIQYINTVGEDCGVSSYPSGIDALMNSLPMSCNIAHPSVVMRMRFIEKVGGYRRFYQYAEDYDLWLRLLEVSNLANLNEVLTRYRLHENQISNRKSVQQIAASRAAQHSYISRRNLGIDLSSIYSSAEEWNMLHLSGSQSETSLVQDVIYRKMIRSIQERNYINFIKYSLRFLFLFPIKFVRVFCGKLRKEFL